MTLKDYLGVGLTREGAEAEMYRVASEAGAGKFQEDSTRYEVSVGVDLTRGKQDTDYNLALQSAVKAARLGDGFVEGVHKLEVTAMGRFEAPKTAAKPAGIGGGAAPKTESQGLTSLLL